MTQFFDESGAVVPVTVIEAGPCPVTQILNEDVDGYAAVQLGWGERKEKHSTAPARGHAGKAGLEAAPVLLREFRVAPDATYELGQRLTVELFEPGESVKLTGTTKGRGFQGVVKRWGFGGRPGGHGHPNKRTPGSIGPGTDPSRVIKGKKMPGQMGNKQQTLRSVRIVKVDAERNLIFVRGPVPGARNSTVLIRKLS
jgi:large subunit ribosomal protein L3